MPNFNYGNYPYGMPYQPYNNNNNFNNMGNYNQQPQMQQQVQANSYYYVNGSIGAKSFQMQPNQTVLLMDSDSPMCYMKSSNAVGQSTLRYFKLTEISENELNNNTNVSNNQQLNDDYVLKADFNALNDKVNDILTKLEKPYKKENYKANKEE